MIPYEALLPDVLQKLFNEGIDEASFNKNRALYAIKRRYAAFVKEAHLIKRTFVLTGQANVNEYALWKINGEIINKIYSVVVDGCCYELGRSCSCNCCPNTFNYQDGVLCLCPAPTCDGDEIEVCASVFPSVDECEMDERIYELYGQQIAHGAVMDLLSKRVGDDYRADYETGISAARRSAARQWSRRPAKKERRWVRR